VDVKKLEKREAKLKAKIEKRERRDLHEGSKLLEQEKKEVRLQLFSFPRILSTFWFKAILRRTVHDHEGELGYYLSCLSGSSASTRNVCMIICVGRCESLANYRDTLCR